MTVSTDLSEHRFYPNVGVGEAVPFQYSNAAHVTVWRLSATTPPVRLTRDTHYAITGDGMAKTGEVTALVTDSAQWSIIRRTEQRQKQPFPPHVPLPSFSVEQQLDRLTFVDQEQGRDIGEIDARALKALPGQALAPINKGDFVGKFLAGGPSGDVIPASGTGNDPALRTDLAQASGAALIGFAIGKSVLDKLNELKSLHEARESNDPDDSNALRSLIDDGYLNVYAEAYKGTGNLGAYRIKSNPWSNAEIADPSSPYYDPDWTLADLIESPGNLVSGLRITGDGMGKTVFDQDGGNYLLSANSRSDDVQDNIFGVEIRDLTLRGMEVPVFAEPQHIVAAHGVTGLTFERVMFDGPCGDGLWLAMGPKPDTIRHNYRLKVNQCIFNGRNFQNRNGISIEDCVEADIINSAFVRLTRGDMVAAIDLEARDRPQYAVRAIRITRNRFLDLGRAAFAAYLNDPDYYDVKPQGVVFQGNYIDTAPMGVEALGAGGDDVASRVNRHGLVATDNTMFNVEQPMRCRGMFGFDFCHNTLDNVGSMQLGLLVDASSREVRINDNTIVGGGRTNGAVLLHDDTTYDCEFLRNRVIESGLPTGGGWVVLGRKGNVELRVEDNYVRDPDERLGAFSQLGGGVGTVSALSTKGGNVCPDRNLFAIDNFNPPVPISGMSGTAPLSATIAAGTTEFFDVTVAGSDPADMTAWVATIDVGIGPTDKIIVHPPITRTPATVRVPIENKGSAGFTLTGATLLVRQAA